MFFKERLKDTGIVLESNCHLSFLHSLLCGILLQFKERNPSVSVVENVSIHLWNGRRVKVSFFHLSM